MVFFPFLLGFALWVRILILCIMSILCLYVICNFDMTDSLHLYAGLRLYCTGVPLIPFGLMIP